MHRIENAQLNSLSGFHSANPEYSFPTISDDPFTIEGKGVGHPLIKKEKRISNEFDFSGKGGICLITGSNMSGKSTFLRTVGVNSVLALMGAPVCAKSLDISHLQVFTSMRTQDDLEESVSSFYAELKRLKQLLGSINSDTPILFMIDEVLKGTNSEDRHKGAKLIDPQILVNLHAVPWKQSDFGGAITRVTGQDFRRLEAFTDYISPMCYSHMVKRKPAWVNEVVTDINGQIHSSKVLPSIQVSQAYLEDSIDTTEFRATLKSALKEPSSGVIFWSWEALTKSPEKKEIVATILKGT